MSDRSDSKKLPPASAAPVAKYVGGLFAPDLKTLLNCDVWDEQRFSRSIEDALRRGEDPSAKH